MFDCILFDLDGTLTNPKEGITGCVQYALSSIGKQADSLEELEYFIGPPLKEQFKIHTGCDNKTAEELLLKYRERFSVIGLYENEIYDGISKLLEKLKNEDKKIALATSKPTVYAVKILEHFDIYKYFDLCVGSELDGKRVEKEDVICEVLNVLKPDLSKTVMIGDRKFDINAAKASGIASVGVTYGFAEEKELEISNPDYIANTVDELEKILLS